MPIHKSDSFVPKTQFLVVPVHLTMAVPTMLSKPRSTERLDRWNKSGRKSSSPPLCRILVRLAWTVVAAGIAVYVWINQADLLRLHGEFNMSVLQQQSVETLQPQKPVAYVLSLIKCGDHQSNVGGLVDAAAIFAYSVHRHSVRHPSSLSKYDFQLYAIVHSDAESCSGALQNLGFELLVRNSPVQLSEMHETLRQPASTEWCCGEKEFVKLYAYTLLQHDLVVHVDMDFVFTQPLDDLYDALLYDANSPTGKAARAKIPLERPTDPWPATIEAFVTRDWGQVIPGRKAGYQAGFAVLRPSLEIFEQVLQTIRTTEYVAGYAYENGWAGKVRVWLAEEWVSPDSLFFCS